MSQALALVTDEDGTDLAELTGLSRAELAALTGQAGDTLQVAGIPKVFLNIETEIEQDDKVVEVPVKTIALRHPDLGLVFFKTATVKMLMTRYLYRRWDAVKKEWSQVSTMIEDYRSGREAPDTLGNVNCGKFTGYYSPDEWAALPKDVQDYQKGARRARAVYFLISGEAINLEGKTVNVEPTLASYFAPAQPQKVIGNAIAGIQKRKGLLFEYNTTWTVVIDRTGAKPQPNVNIDVDYSAKVPLDKVTLAAIATINEDITAHNDYVMQRHNEALRKANSANNVVDVTDFIDVTSGGDDE
jgi:hypothetical protein